MQAVAVGSYITYFNEKHESMGYLLCHLCGVVCVIASLDVLIQYRRVTDRHTDTDTHGSITPR